MEFAGKENKGLKITLIIFQVIWLIGYLGMTVFSVGLGVRDYLSIIANPGAGHNGMAFVLVVALIGSVTYGIVTGIGLINLVLSIINKYSKKRKYNIITSMVGIVLPYLTEVLLLFLFGKLF